ncbi:hypothetical protein HPB51_001214 [Rhipicephalus microplus]|uniref:Uncharacterized protein n=1 Tax=Rhipicephalus microplus TaxID=6941 RepID=A0A9J6DSF2_RHIMP|nr:hypothetical protein HPB51_001214 [Rhipicephalus microplus]
MDVDEAGTGEATDHRTEQTRSVSASEDEDADSVADGWIEVTRKKKKRTREQKQDGETRRHAFTKPDASRPPQHCQQGSTSKQDAQTAQGRYQDGAKAVVRAEVGVGGEAAARTDTTRQQDIGGATPGGKQKGPRNITWRDIVTGTKADSAQGHPLSGRPRAAADPGLAARMENMEKENRELRQELAKARKQNEKSTRKIEELQQTLNEILERMGGHPAETPSSGASSSHGAADERDTTLAVGDGDTEGGEYEAPVAVAFNPRSSERLP